MTQSKAKSPLLALVGNPNAGKTTLFNTLCGIRQKTANYPGATVDLKEGQLKALGGTAYRVLDLPGLYSLDAVSEDEKIALRVITGQDPNYSQPDLLLCVVDASNLKRNLYLFSQLAASEVPCLVVLTMIDMLGRSKQNINLDGLTAELGVPVVQLHAKNAQSLVDLKAAINQALAKPKLPTAVVKLPHELEQAIERLQKSWFDTDPQLNRYQMLSVLTSPLSKMTDLGLGVSNQELIERCQADLQIHPAMLSSRRYRWIAKVDQKLRQPSGPVSVTLSERIDHILTHRVWGLAIFGLIMFVVFQSIYTGAGPFMDLIELGFGTFADWISSTLDSFPVLQSLLADGLIAGVGSVVIFLPQILLLFLFIAFLEDSGYMARAAFLMDRLLSWTGLNGRAFIPMLSSFACAVPGVMAARVMPDARARLTTVLVAPLMSCSARLPVYVLLIGALIEPQFGAFWGALCLFAFHLLGLFVAMPTAFILNRGVLKTPSIPFVLEMPAYRMPDLKSVCLRVYDAGMRFLVQAGTIIFAMSILIWALSYFPRSADVAQKINLQNESQLQELSEQPQAQAVLQSQIDNQIAGTYLEQSYLGRMGHFVQPIFEPLGFNWKITVGILGAFPAREVIIATLGIVYQVGEADEESDSLRSSIQNDRHADGSIVFTPLVAITLMIFFALCSQCMSTLATVYRELGSWRWTLFLFSYMTILAYVFALIVYQGGRYLGWG